MEPLLAYFGHHKCGTTWIRQVVDDVCAAAQLKVALHHLDYLFRGDILAYRSQQQFDFWNYTNADITFVRGVPLRGFHVVRDPRDVVVSAYFSHLNSHPDSDWPWLQRHRSYLRSLSKQDGLRAEIEVNSVYLYHMLTWDYSNPDILELRFEDMIGNDVGSFVRIFSFLGLVPQKIAVPQIVATASKFSFANLSKGRARGQEDAKSHFRKGQPGDWRNHFEPSHIDYFKKLYNPLLLKLGYETNEDWSTDTPRIPETKPKSGTYEKGLALYQAGKYEEAAKVLHQALQESETAERWNDWATAEWFCGRAEQAEMGYRQALRLEPDHAQAALNLSVVIVNSKK